MEGAKKYFHKKKAPNPRPAIRAVIPTPRPALAPVDKPPPLPVSVLVTPTVQFCIGMFEVAPTMKIALEGAVLAVTWIVIRPALEALTVSKLVPSELVVVLFCTAPLIRACAVRMPALMLLIEKMIFSLF